MLTADLALNRLLGQHGQIPDMWLQDIALVNMPH